MSSILNLARLTIFFVLLASCPVKAAEDTASICNPGEVIVVTHPGDSTVIRCQLDNDAPIINVPHAAPAATRVVVVRKPAVHRHHYPRKHSASLSDVLRSLFSPHRGR